MIIVNLLILSVCMMIISLSIHHGDEIHQLIAWLSGLIALICILILTPSLIKGLLGIVFFVAGHKLFPAYKSFR